MARPWRQSSRAIQFDLLAAARLNLPKSCVIDRENIYVKTIYRRRFGMGVGGDPGRL
jgi:hypothetical protein